MKEGGRMEVRKYGGLCAKLVEERAFMVSHLAWFVRGGEE